MSARRKQIKKYILNDRIRASKVRVIADDGEQLGIMAIEDAQARAVEKGLDLLLVSENSDPPVCRIVDYGQFKYQQQKKDKLARKASKNHVVKELKLSPKISEHDFMVRYNRGVGFLNKGYKIKVSVMFRGREIMHPELGRKMIQRYMDDILELGIGEIDGKINQSNRIMFVLINSKV